MRTEAREHARRLRGEKGLPINEIARLVGAAPSSVSRWVRDMPLTEEQIASVRRRNPSYGDQLRGAHRNAERARQRRLAAQASGRALIRDRDPLHLAGAMLYWGEGDKWGTNTARITNADPELLRVFVSFARSAFAVPDDRFRVTCYLFTDHVDAQAVVEQYWLEALGLPQLCLMKSIVNQYSRSTQHRRERVLPYGTCRVTINSTFVLQSIYGAIQEYGGFDRPEWLG